MVWQAAEERSLNAECKMQTVKCLLFSAFGI